MKGTVLASLLAALAVGGCGELTAGGFAHTDVVLSGDAPDTVASATHVTSVVPAPTSSDAPAGSAPAPLSAGPITGQVTATLDVSVQASDGHWIELTSGPQEATVDISGATDATLAEGRLLDAGLYSRVRVRFISVSARIDSGLPGVATVHVDFGDSTSVTVERPLNLNVQDGDSVQLLVDLNSAQWLHAAAPALGTVAAVHLRNAVEVRVR